MSGPAKAVGDAGLATLHGTSGRDTLSGAGEDIVRGGAGNDVLAGGRLDGLADGDDGDAALTGPVTRVTRGDSLADFGTRFTNGAATRVGGVNVARIRGSTGGWQGNPSLTITRGVVF